MTARTPRPPSPAQREVLALARDGCIKLATHWPHRRYAHYADGPIRNQVTASVEALMRAGLLETGPFIALGTPRLAMLTDAGRRMLEQITATDTGGAT